ncbi:sialic acid-specific 9-O-acetylesterase [Rhodopirellula maiorica SM1]|uniref:Sialic acid-specific 9-O-acetylesterase n=1 Tax=Rhodopirellula maiorica SM1 TaxID=1265738 RepID=M5RR78_9BACT|nr:sialate O-acetylesterase [Rhodopirellula maiorica]EMI21833.1 sialic acid-specific 9-O-acetylesterase [Rhodopirellula maiorica SM1]
MTRKKQFGLALAFSLLPVSLGYADVSLPAIFSDHMVLQQETEVPVWGWAEPGEEVKVAINGQTKTTQTGDDGSWSIKLDSLKPGEPTTIKVSGKNEITIEDVLIGEVWLGSGQSNMAMTVNRANDFAGEQKKAALPTIRMFKENSGSSATPEKVGNGEWQVCSSETVGGFSATLFFFGREIHADLDVPVGLINSSVGGTPIEAWIDADVQRADKNLQPLFAERKPVDLETQKANYERALKRYQAQVKKAKAEGKPLPRKPRDPASVQARKGNVGGLFNGKIAPLIPYAIRGAIWYQGEANSTPSKAPFYQYQLPLLIQDWRERWGYDFPFGWAQLPNYSGNGRDWPTVREAMLKTLSVPNTGMGINIDIGDTKDIHPKNKQEVGRRLSLWALGSVYEQEVAAVSGPLPDGHEIQGDKVVVRFKHAEGLESSGGPIVGFEITADGETWVPAEAEIDGESIVVSSDEVAKPTAVRYAWTNDPKTNLFNGAGLPATPFRTNP